MYGDENQDVVSDYGNYNDTDIVDEVVDDVVDEPVEEVTDESDYSNEGIIEYNEEDEDDDDMIIDDQDNQTDSDYGMDNTVDDTEYQVNLQVDEDPADTGDIYESAPVDDELAETVDNYGQYVNDQYTNDGYESYDQ